MTDMPSYDSFPSVFAPANGVAVWDDLRFGEQQQQQQQQQISRASYPLTPVCMFCLLTASLIETYSK
jgi:hypothetical protein